MHQLLTGISLSIRIHTRESSLCSIIRVQQKPLPNRTVLFSKVLLYRISSSLWPLVKQGNKLGEGRQVKCRRPKLQMTGFFWRICTYTWFGLKASFLGGKREQRNFFAFRFIWPPRSAWPKELVKLRQLRPYIQLSSPSGAYSRSIVTDLVASEMGGLVPSLLASNSLIMHQYSTRKGFSQTREKVVDLKRKKFGGSSSAKLLLNLNCFSSQDWIYM